MSDTFVWNLNGLYLFFLKVSLLINKTDRIVNPEALAQSTLKDYALAPSYHSGHHQVHPGRALLFPGPIGGL
jgi:hypothetical protein